MKKTMSGAIIILSIFLIMSSCKSNKAVKGERWSAEKANEWYKKQGWICGSNFGPSTAINQLEMWQAETFDTTTIDKELGYAESIGMNTMRVFLHNVAFEKDSSGFFKRIDQYLAIAARHKIKTMFVLFDACWNPVCNAGKQPEPVPFKHNSGWIQCPSSDMLKDTAHYQHLENYLKKVISHYANDERILLWDLFNEPDNDNFGKFKTELSDKRTYTLYLLKKSFEWARDVNPSQPLSSGVWWQDWSDTSKLSAFNDFQLKHSDVITFHNYDSLYKFKERANQLKCFGRPLICSEYMARPNGSTFKDILPFMKENNIGAINWGFVAGKTNTIYPWDSWDKAYTAEPKVWFHDVFRMNGTPYDSTEIKLIKNLTGKK